MCLRNIHGGIENPLLKLNDWTLEQFKTILKTLSSPKDKIEISIKFVNTGPVINCPATNPVTKSLTCEKI
jgi:hypothetical protein